MDINNFELIIRLLIAVFCGAVVGLEREKKNQAAGLRTHITVILGATLVMLISKYGFTDVDINTKDPARLAAQVVSGIGFLGAGMIIINRNKVRGLTTAASLWTTACIGLAIGAGFYVPAIASTIILFCTLYFLQFIEVRSVEKGFKVFVADVTDKDGFLTELEPVLAKDNISMEKIEIQDDVYDEDYTEEELNKIKRVRIYLHLPEYADCSFLVGDLSRIKGVRKVKEKNG